MLTLPMSYTTLLLLLNNGICDYVVPFVGCWFWATSTAAILDPCPLWPNAWMEAGLGPGDVVQFMVALRPMQFVLLSSYFLA